MTLVFIHSTSCVRTSGSKPKLRFSHILKLWFKLFFKVFFKISKYFKTKKYKYFLKAKINTPKPALFEILWPVDYIILLGIVYLYILKNWKQQDLQFCKYFFICDIFSDNFLTGAIFVMKTSIV